MKRNDIKLVTLIILGLLVLLGACLLLLKTLGKKEESSDIVPTSSPVEEVTSTKSGQFPLEWTPLGETFDENGNLIVDTDDVIIIEEEMPDYEDGDFILDDEGGDPPYQDVYVVEDTADWVDKRAYMQKIMPMARDVAERYNVNEYILLGFAVEYSMYGQSELAKTYNNPIGITADNGLIGVELTIEFHDRAGVVNTDEKVYKTYLSEKECFEDFASVLVAYDIGADTDYWEAARILCEKTDYVKEHYIDYIAMKCSSLEKSMGD